MTKECFGHVKRSAASAGGLIFRFVNSLITPESTSSYFMYNLSIHQVFFYRVELTTIKFVSTFSFSPITCASPEFRVIEQILEGPNRGTCF